MSYYEFLLLCLDLWISLIDIPFINNLQTQVPENIRGRAISVSASAVKIFTPIGYLLSGGVIGIVPAFDLPLYGGVLPTAFHFVIHMETVKAHVAPGKTKQPAFRREEQRQIT